MRRAQGVPIETIGVIILVVLVVVVVAMFFFAGLGQQGGILGQTSNQTVGNLGTKLDASLACVPPYSCGDSVCCSGENCAIDCGS